VAGVRRPGGCRAGPGMGSGQRRPGAGRAVRGRRRLGPAGQGTGGGGSGPRSRVSQREWGGAQALNYLTTFRCGGVSPVKKNTENN
jgi:hypothetical protein